MARLFILFFVVALAGNVSAAPSSRGTYSFNLKPYLGTPVLLVFGASKKDTNVASQLEVIRSHDGDLRKAGVRLLYAFEQGEGRNGTLSLRESDAQELRKSFGISSGGFQVVLIGKDGKRLGESSSPLNSENLLSWISKKLKSKK